MFLAIADGTRYSMVVHPDVKDPISIDLKDVTVLEALETIHFNNLSCAAIMSDPKRCDGIVTTETLLKAFFDSTDKAFTAMPC